MILEVHIIRQSIMINTKVRMMNMKKIKILIACGSGIATSTIGADVVKEICKNLKISSFEIIKCTMTEISSMEKNVDLILTTNNYTGKTQIPHISITGFITGINEDALREKVKKQILGIYQQLKQ